MSYKVLNWNNMPAPIPRALHHPRRFLCMLPVNGSPIVAHDALILWSHDSLNGAVNHTGRHSPEDAYTPRPNYIVMRDRSNPELTIVSSMRLMRE